MLQKRLMARPVRMHVPIAIFKFQHIWRSAGVALRLKRQEVNGGRFIGPALLAVQLAQTYDSEHSNQMVPRNRNLPPNPDSAG